MLYGALQIPGYVLEGYTLVKQTHISPEQELEDLILAQIKSKEKEYNRQGHANRLTITITLILIQQVYDS